MDEHVEGDAGKRCKAEERRTSGWNDRVSESEPWMVEM